MSAFRRFAVAAVTAGLFLQPAFAFAYGNGTPDGAPPADEVVCDPNVGLRGPA